MRKLIRSVLQRLGYDIVKFKPVFVRGKMDGKDLTAEYKWLREYNFRTIIDIGANEGQFSDRIRLLFPDAFIYAFEPLPGVFRRLQDNFGDDAKFKAYNLGLGEKKEELQFYENDYSPSSSFLKINSSLIANFEEAANTKKVTVYADRMDSLFDGRNLEMPLLVKIDVQGYEDRVMSGGMGTLQKARLVICELSFVALYEEQLLFADMYEKFKSMGFTFAGIVEDVRSPESNRILQADCIFIKE